MLNPAAALAGVDPLLMAGAAAMTFGAAYIRGLTGFGMAIILVPLLGLIVTPGEAVVLGIFLQVLIGPIGLKIIYADADRTSALTIGAFAVVATPLGIWLLTQTTPDVARLLIAAIAIGRSCSSCCRKRSASNPAQRRRQQPASHQAYSPASPRCLARRSCPITCASRSNQPRRALR